MKYGHSDCATVHHIIIEQHNASGASPIDINWLFNSLFTDNCAMVFEQKWLHIGYITHTNSSMKGHSPSQRTLFHFQKHLVPQLRMSSFNLKYIFWAHPSHEEIDLPEAALTKKKRRNRNEGCKRRIREKKRELNHALPSYPRGMLLLTPPKTLIIQFFIHRRCATGGRNDWYPHIIIPLMS